MRWRGWRLSSKNASPTGGGVDVSELKRILIGTIAPITADLVTALSSRGLETVAVFSTTTVDSDWLQGADYDVYVGDGEHDSELSCDRLVGSALDAGCDAMLPGDAVASKRELHELASSANLAILGVDVQMYDGLADPVKRREIADACGVLCVPTSEYLESSGMEEAAKLGVPLVVSSEHGEASRIVGSLDDLEAAVGWVRAATPTSKGGVYLRRSTSHLRLLATLAVSDQHGNVCCLGVADISACGDRGVEVVVMDGVLSDEATESICRATERLLTARATTGVHRLLWAVEDGETAYLSGYRGGVPAWFRLVDQVFGVDLIDVVFQVAEGHPLAWPKQLLPLTSGVHVIASNRTYVAPDRPTAADLARTGLDEGASEGLRALLGNADFHSGSLTVHAASQLLSA